jgi:hypothetical protein
VVAPGDCDQDDSYPMCDATQEVCAQRQRHDVCGGGCELQAGNWCSMCTTLLLLNCCWPGAAVLLAGHLPIYRTVQCNNCIAPQNFVDCPAFRTLLPKICCIIVSNQLLSLLENGFNFA